MQKSDISSIDLNLLKFLDALLRERNVTRAGARLNLSQPAASRALGRLRLLFKDKVVIRTPNGVEPTPRMLAMEPLVTRVLEDVRIIVAPPRFEPSTTQHRFTIACLDHIASIVLPTLVGHIEKDAPGVKLEVPAPNGNNIRSVGQGDADIALGVFEDGQLPAGFYRRWLYDEDLVCVVRRGHPILSSQLTLAKFAAQSHVVVTITGQGNAMIDTALASQGKSRQVAVRLPHFLVAPMIVAESDLVLSLPRRLASHMAQWAPLELVELPLKVDMFSLSMIWHERTHGDPAQIWLRRQITELLQE